MKRFRVVTRVLAIVSGGSLACLSSASLLQNGSFEGPGLPSWENFGYSPNALLNVYNNTGANSFFLPASYGNFDGVTAQDGAQFVAGGASNSGSGYINQLLSTPLVPGEPYKVQAWLQRSSRPDLNVPATYEVLLCPSNSSFVGAVSVGEFSPNAPFNQGWVSRSITFVAPPTADVLPSICFISKRAPGQSFAYSAIDNVSLSPAEPATLSGTVSLNDFVGALDQETVDVIIRGPADGMIGTYEDVPLAADGSYSVEVAAFADCTVSVRGRTWIRSRSEVVSFVPNETLVLNYVLSNGDSDQSGEVDAADIDLIIAKFGTTLGDPDYHLNADLDGSTEVDAADIDIAIANFGETDE